MGKKRNVKTAFFFFESWQRETVIRSLILLALEKKKYPSHAVKRKIKRICSGTKKNYGRAEREGRGQIAGEGGAGLNHNLWGGKAVSKRKKPTAVKSNVGKGRGLSQKEKGFHTKEEEGDGFHFLKKKKNPDV